MMKDIAFIKLNNGLESFWALPTSGFGNFCDEQPLPYLKFKNIDISPRLGGEVGQNNYDEKVIPLPYGKLKNNWPIKQIIFNFKRKRTNLYWRNLFENRCPKNKLFFFNSQLNFYFKNKNIYGNSPLINFLREFKINEKNIKVIDKIKFKKNLEFDYLIVNPLIRLNFNSTNLLKIETSLKHNLKINFKSSTGDAIYTSHKINNCKFNKGNEIHTELLYKFL